MNSIEYRNRRDHQRDQEAAGNVADSMDVRRALLERFHAGEMTLVEVQAELARIKRGAKASGKITRNQAFQGRSA